MKIIRTKDYKEMSRRAANILSAQVILKPDSVLGLATGSTPLGVYARLVDGYNRGDLDFSRVFTVNLDEYCGLPEDNEQSYHYFMRHNLFRHINLPEEHTFVPDGMEADSTLACKSYEMIIRRLGGIDLQLLGLGNNGHIGFNEPGPVFEKETHPVDLSESTIHANARFFDKIEQVPTRAYTMGIGTIMQARRILVIVNGSGKADITARAFRGPVTPQVPASILLLHPDVTLVADEEALAEMPL